MFKIKKITKERKESSGWFLRHKILCDRKMASHEDVLKLPFVEEKTPRGQVEENMPLAPRKRT